MLVYHKTASAGPIIVYDLDLSATSRFRDILARGRIGATQEKVLPLDSWTYEFLYSQQFATKFPPSIKKGTKSVPGNRSSCSCVEGKWWSSSPNGYPIEEI